MEDETKKSVLASGPPNTGRNLGLTFWFYLVTAIFVAYLGTLVIEEEEELDPDMPELEPIPHVEEDLRGHQLGLAERAPSTRGGDETEETSGGELQFEDGVQDIMVQDPVALLIHWDDRMEVLRWTGRYHVQGSAPVLQEVPQFRWVYTVEHGAPWEDAAEELVHELEWSCLLYTSDAADE